VPQRYNFFLNCRSSYRHSLPSRAAQLPLFAVPYPKVDSSIKCKISQYI